MYVIEFVSPCISVFKRFLMIGSLSSLMVSCFFPSAEWRLGGGKVNDKAHVVLKED